MATPEAETATQTGTAVGDQETPSQWKKVTTQDAYEAPRAESPKKLVLCSFDEDETQICFRCMSQEDYLSQTVDAKRKTLMTLEERKLIITSHRPDDADGDDDESGNESEDMWVGGTSLLAHWETDVYKSNERQSQVISELPTWTPSAAFTPTNPVASDTETMASEDDDDAATETNSAMASDSEKTASPPTEPLELPNDDLPSADEPIQTEPVDLPGVTAPTADEPMHTESTPTTPIISEIHAEPLPAREKSQDEATEGLSFHEKLLAASHKAKNPPVPKAKKGQKRPAASDEVSSSSPKRPRASKAKVPPVADTPQAPVADAKPKRKAARRTASYTESEVFEASQSMERPRATRRLSETESFPESLASTELSAASSTPDAIRIVLTGIEPTDAIMRKIRAIKGAVFEDDVTKGTHLVSNELKRTVKLLCGISCCLHILDEAWLRASAKMRRPANEIEFSLRDAEKEAKWGFELEHTMYDCSLASRQSFLAAHTFYITPHGDVKPPSTELEKIVRLAGGRVLAKPERGCIVITAPKAIATKAMQKKIQLAAHVCSTELILHGVLTQRLDVAAHALP
ncbi:hypothetical protein SDRG_04362 [Saprolegnia diclina VS20]|uniref:BRCT domain-containing protein n=1 Tax=Saprolegnia diclina (strain VS20) TaxID=1156394 RepID=T0QVG5_SAPDV|nr:hypothetical protein SDRG_04362 [Saprolegnia diclina VS20]EQC38666.1 hypothetical protein SDRG_04362 [Saprolegnia diclina VS20]|eukprot:XP_008608258.1 hypothetical protein SDRG_04362 [Saprolegnia diclina VS20]